MVLKQTPGAFHQEVVGGQRELRSELSDHLARISRANLTTMARADWAQWWDDLEAQLIALGAPIESVRLRRDNYEQVVADVLPTVAAFPQLPLSTGGVEVAARRRVEPLLENRGHSFANLERTNRLFDLVICDEHGLFNRMPKVIDLIRSDSAASNGWGSPLRMVADPQPPAATAWSGRYSSLRDQLLLREIARSKGLT